jgi:uncharacterized protein YndB with AHSA1/START domain
MHLNPETDLELEKRIPARPETVRRGCSDPALFAQWLAPKPVDMRDVDGEVHPVAQPFLTAILTPDGDGKLYRAEILHGSEAAREKHLNIGFIARWGIVVEQRAALDEGLEARGT